MKSNTALRIKTPLKLAVGLTLLIVSSGCSTVVLHPIEKTDIVAMTKGQSYTPEKDGWFLSNYYLEKVVQAKVQR